MLIVKNRWAVHTAAKRKGMPMDRHVSCVSRRQFVAGAPRTPEDAAVSASPAMPSPANRRPRVTLVRMLRLSGRVEWIVS